MAKRARPPGRVLSAAPPPVETYTLTPEATRRLDTIVARWNVTRRELDGAVPLATRAEVIAQLLDGEFERLALWATALGAPRPRGRGR